MFLRKIGAGVGALAATMMATAGAAYAMPKPWEMDLQPAVTPVMSPAPDADAVCQRSPDDVYTRLSPATGVLMASILG